MITLISVKKKLLSLISGIAAFSPKFILLSYSYLLVHVSSSDWLRSWFLVQYLHCIKLA